MSAESVKAMIDHLVDRYGNSDATSRASCLRWVQLAEDEVWGAENWWFKQGREAVALSSGLAVYTLSVNNERIDAVELDDGGALSALSPDVFREVYGSDASSGAPQVWCPLEPLAAGYPRIQVWPVPTSGSLSAVYRRGVSALEDDDGGESKSQLPPDWRHLVLLRAEVYASLKLGQAQAAKDFLEEFGIQLGALRELNRSQAQRLGLPAMKGR